MELLQQAISKGSCLLKVRADDFPSLLSKVLDEIVERGLLPADAREPVEAALLAREEQTSSALGREIAVPHVYLDELPEPLIVFVRLTRPINMGAPDGTPTRFIFMLLGPKSATARHLDTLANIARLMSDDAFHYDLRRARNEQGVLTALEAFAVRTAAPVPVEEPEVPDGLRYTGRLFGGIREDLKRRLPYYVSDFVNGLHPKCFASILFLYFACLAPAVTFGGVMAAQTGGQIGAVEMITASAICGVIFALFSGQGLIILGGTGPLLIFTTMLYRLCTDLEIPFLPTYAWVGLWTALIVFILAATDASCLVRYCTRFTDEIFSALISLIFIYEAIRSLIVVFQDLDVKKHHDTALLTVLLALGTLYVSTSLSAFRRSRYLMPKAREFLADFGPAIAIASMTGIAVWLNEVDLDVLPAPDTFSTSTGRPWLLNLTDAPRWVWFASIGPAILGSVLVFLEKNIAERLVNAPQNKLVDGQAYHLNLAVIGVLIGACSMFGLPWLVAAMVRSLNHLHSLATYEEVITRDGERHDRIIHVRSNRVTGLMIHLLLGGSLMLLPLLKIIPMATLYGLFLYMGIVSMKGNQFFERLSLWPMDQALYPATHYIRQVRNATIHKYTALQAVCLAILWAIKASVLGILFPLFIGLLVPVRMIAGRFFSESDLRALDSSELPAEEAGDLLP